MQIWGRGDIGVFGVIWGQNPNIFKPREIMYKNEALGPVIKNKWFSRSSDPKITDIWGHGLGRNPNNFKPRQSIYQNEALGPFIKNL